MSIDLHCHTRMSDGSLGIEELIVVAKRRGVTALAVTDHDTTASSTRALLLGKRYEINVLHGIEITTWDTPRHRAASLLCYLCEVPDRLEGVLRDCVENRRKAMAETIKRILRYFPITPEIIARCATGSFGTYKVHIMQALMETGYTDSIYGELYDKLFGTPEKFPSEQPVFPDTRIMLDRIHEAGGVAVLAYPTEGDGALMEELTARKLDGIEVYTPEHDEKTTAALLEYAAENKLIATGGTNFHGMYSKQPVTVGSVLIPETVLGELKAAKDKRLKGKD